MRRLSLFLFSILFVTAALAQKQFPAEFTNPLLPSGADPRVTYKNHYYYYTQTTGSNLQLWKTKSMARLNKAPRKVIWSPPLGKAFSKELWAPELHFLRRKWYMYFAADDGDNNHHRLYVLENASPDPFKGTWLFKGKVGDVTNKWAIDASVFENNGELFLLWSGWEGDANGQQNIYIAKMSNPLTVSSKRTKLSSPDHSWEKYGDLHDQVNPAHVNVNEGPELLAHGNKLFLIYSASGCWTDHYALGMLSSAKGSNLLDSSSWKKSAQPVFKESLKNGVYAPGHNGFFKSPNGKEDWIIYHANPKPGCGCDGQRSPRMQRFRWNKNGTPDFGVPVKESVQLQAPLE